MYHFEHLSQLICITFFRVCQLTFGSSRFVSRYHKISSEYKFYTLQNVLITLSGAWKLGGFGFTISASQTYGDSANMQAFHYTVSKTSDEIRVYYIDLFS